MKLLSAVARELLGLFLDDEFLALAILVVVVLAAVADWIDLAGLAVGAILLVGCIGVLAASLSRANRPAAGQASVRPSMETEAPDA